MRVHGSHAIVTGGAGGIGRAVAGAFLAAEGNVTLLDLDGARTREVAAALRSTAVGRQVRAEPVDVADPAGLRAAVERSEAALGACDLLVCCAGVSEPGDVLVLPDAAFRRAMDVNYLGTVHAIRAVAPGMVARRSGAVVAVGSSAAYYGSYGYAAYAPSKWAVRGLLDVLREELTPHGVHVGGVYPPDVRTAMLVAEEAAFPPAARAIHGTSSPIETEEVAAAVLACVSEERFRVFPGAGTEERCRKRQVEPDAVFDRHREIIEAELRQAAV